VYVTDTETLTAGFRVLGSLIDGVDVYYMWAQVWRSGWPSYKLDRDLLATNVYLSADIGPPIRVDAITYTPDIQVSENVYYSELLAGAVMWYQGPGWWLAKSTIGPSVGFYYRLGWDKFTPAPYPTITYPAVAGWYKAGTSGYMYPGQFNPAGTWLGADGRPSRNIRASDVVSAKNQPGAQEGSIIWQ
jgi:hypothetical protein